MMGPTKKLANFVAETNLEDIPSHVVEEAKNLILNTLGAILAGTAIEKTAKIGIDLVREAGGKPQSTVIGGGFKTSALMAALANGISAHATDQDDTDWRIVAHPTPCILPAVLALGEHRHAPGKQVLESYILGVEAEGNVGLGVMPMSFLTGFHGTGIFGHVGATVGCCKLLRLDAKETETALGIMGSLVSGIRHNVGSMSKPLFGGNCAKNGIIAATLAQRGFTAVEDILEGTHGYARCFGGPDAQPERMVRDLGKPYIIESPGITYKGAPCGTYGPVLTEAIQDMMKEHDFSTDQIAAIELGTNPAAPSLMRYVYPNDTLEAKYSVPFIIAVSLVDSELTLRQFTDEKIQDPKVREVISKIKLYNHPDLPASPDPSRISAAQLSRTYITIKLANGKEYSCWAETARGYADKPLTEEEILERYRGFASLVVAARPVEQTIKIVKSLDKVMDIGKLMSYLGGR